MRIKGVRRCNSLFWADFLKKTGLSDQGKMANRHDLPNGRPFSCDFPLTWSRDNSFNRVGIAPRDEEENNNATG